MLFESGRIASKIQSQAKRKRNTTKHALRTKERVMEQMKDGARKRNLVSLKESLDPIELQENIPKSLKKLFSLMKPESIL